MTKDLMLHSKIELLHSEKLKEELLSFMEYLLSKQFVDEGRAKRVPRFGCAQGKFKMSADFDAPIEGFEDYMP